MAGNWDQKGRKSLGRSVITRKEQRFRKKPTRLCPAFLRVEEEVKNPKPQDRVPHSSCSWQRIRYQLTPLSSELVISPLVSVIPRNKGKRPEIRPDLTAPTPTQRLSPTPPRSGDPPQDLHRAPPRRRQQAPARQSSSRCRGRFALEGIAPLPASPALLAAFAAARKR